MSETCGCLQLPNGDIPCHVCGQYVNVRCWNCRTPRGEGPCPHPRRETGGEDFATWLGVTSANAILRHWDEVDRRLGGPFS